MSTAIEESKELPWIDATEARRRLNCTHHALQRLVESRRITGRRIPGARPRYLASDVDFVVKQFTTEAVREVQAATT